MPEWMDIPSLVAEHPEKAIHMERYEYAGQRLAGKRVLDCACGMGYGADMLRSAGCVTTGVDIDPAAIALAQERYPDTTYSVGDLYETRMDAYDALACFETLEHLDRPQEVIDGLPESVVEIVASAPIRPTVGWNRWHRTDFTHGSLCRLIERAFTIVHLIGQPWTDGKGDLYLMVHGKRKAYT